MNLTIQSLLHKLSTRIHELLTAGAFLFLAWGCAPGVWWRDAGQLTASSFSLGVPHPTGFPLYMMMGKLSTFIPVGSIAFRMNLLSAACAAGAVGFISAASVRLSNTEGDTRDTRLIAAAVAGISLLLAQPFVLHAMTAEIYAPTALLMAASLWIWSRLRENEESRPRAILAVLTGLGLCLHLASFALFALVVWLGIFIRDLLSAPGRSLWKRRGWIWVLLGLSTLLCYLYLPLATLHDPWRNWGDPATWGRFWTHISAGTIRTAFAGNMFDTGTYTMGFHFALYWEELWNGLGLLTAFGVAGLYTLARKRRWDALFILLGLWGADAFFTIFVNPMGIEDHQTIVPSLLVLTLASGIGAAEIMRTIPFGKGWHRAILVGGLAIGAFMVGSPSIETDRSDDTFPSLYAQEILVSAPPGATLFLASDDSSGLISHALGVEGARPDLSIIYSAHLYDRQEVLHWSRLYGNHLLPEPTLDWMKSLGEEGSNSLHQNEHQQQLVWQMIGLPESIYSTHATKWRQQDIPADWMSGHNPVLWEIGEPVFDSWVARWDLLRPGFPFFHLDRPGTAPSLEIETFVRQQKKWEKWAGRPLNSTAKRALGDRARLGASGTDLPALRHSLALARFATQLDPKNHRGWNKLGHFLSQIQEWKAASTAMKAAVALRPDRFKFRLRLAQFLRKAGELKEAQVEAEMALALTEMPFYLAKAHAELARIAHDGGDVSAAKQELEEMTRVAPHDPNVKALSEHLRRELKLP